MGNVKLDIEYIAFLARIKLTEEEKAIFGAQLRTVLDYMEKLREVNVENVEPTSHPLPLVNVMRADKPEPCLARAEAMQNAPLKFNDLFIVPKIVE